LSSREKLSLIEKENCEINLTRQAELLDISRSGIYYQPIIDQREIQIKNAIDEIYTACPFYGSRKIKRELEIKHKIKISRGYVQNLMREMGLQAIYPAKRLNLSQGNKQHKKYPYLLKNLEIVRVNQVWSTDITYIRLKNGFAYLTVIFDWYSRYVISWKLSATLENDFCIQALKEALEMATPEIHNSDQGVQYTAENYIAVLAENRIQISMDGRGRCMDNIFTERLWRTVKYENIYLHDYQDIEEAWTGLAEYFQFYNYRRIHQSLDYLTPAQIYLPNNQLIFKNQISLIKATLLS
jgi:putative transposase